MPSTDAQPLHKPYRFLPGQTVWVRDLAAILQTLDAEGKLDGLPFMPEMTRFCGQSFQVTCLPQKTCVEGVGFRGLTNIVFLDSLRCNGDAHDGCQRECLLFWNEAWLSDKPPAQPAANPAAVSQLKTRQGERYFCQSTELAGATSEYHEERVGLGKKLRQHFRQLQRGEMRLTEFILILLKAVGNRLKPLFGIDTSNTVVGQLHKTESFSLDLQPGDWVEVKSRKEIEQTLDVSGKNKGLLFDPPMLAYCGQRFRVASRLQKIILEETGKMIQLKNTVVLENVTCQAWGCPRANLHFWREIWLRRLTPRPQITGAAGAGK